MEGACENKNTITWKNRAGYSPVQDRTGIKNPAQADFPPAPDRVSQDPDATGRTWLDEQEVMRVTYQGDDRCQLACPGCYTGERLRLPLAEVTASGGRKTVPWGDFTGHVQGLGEGLQDFFLLGAEATMDPAGSATKLAWAREQGLPIQVITHGAVSTERFEATFGAALDSGAVYKVIVSLDSTDPAVNNTLRGRRYAHERTIATIRHCVRRHAPLKVQTTVWPRNYTTVMNTVGDLYREGVRAFAFHCGSLEGVTDPDRHGIDHLDPLAWRALAERLLAFRDEHRDTMRQFNVPYIFFTEDELSGGVIGDADLTRRYLGHVDALRDGRESRKPVHACPALDIPQVYVYGNDGDRKRGTVSLCNIHADRRADAYADYDPDQRRWRVRDDPDTNQLNAMRESPHLCPATPYALRADTDRSDTQAGPLYHACRYIASNQMTVDRDRFGPQAYADACAYYTAVGRALEVYPAPADDGEWPIARVRRLTGGIVPLADRAQILLDDLRDGPGGVNGRRA